MTRFTPGGPPSSEGYQGDSSYNQPYGQQQGYNNAYSAQSGYNGDNGPSGGAAQSYYGSNEQAYQQYPNDTPGQQPNEHYQQDRPHAQSTYGQQGYNAPDYNQSYQSPPPGQGPQSQNQGYTYPAYGQQQSGEVEAFKSHYDRPYGADQNAPSYQQQGVPPGQGGNANDADRGFMGAMAGGAAGAFGGHKMGHHGIIGGVGGAIAGSLLEDAAKKHHKEKKEHEQQEARLHAAAAQAYGQQAPRYDNYGGGSGGNFHASSRGVRLEGHCTLVADCADTSGHHRRSAIDLNHCFTNDDGRLLWQRDGNFAASSRSIRLVDDGRYIEAECCNVNGHWVHNRVHLDERITNDNGRLELTN